MEGNDIVENLDGMAMWGIRECVLSVSQYLLFIQATAKATRRWVALRYLLKTTIRDPAFLTGVPAAEGPFIQLMQTGQRFSCLHREFMG